MSSSPLLKFVVFASTASALALLPLAADSLQVSVDRWLSIQHTTGKVFYRDGSSFKPAALGMKLQAVGDTIRTAERSSTVLAVDTGIGFVRVAEKTTLQIKQLQRLENGGHITQLELLSGQARLQLRPFTNKASRLEVLTPAGVSGVRGTEFGVSTQPSGKTGVATLTGSVVTTAQGRSVAVNAQFQSLVIPGETPTPAMPLKDDPSLDLSNLTRISERQVMLSGQTDSVNFLLINDVAQNTDRDGKFKATTQIPADGNVKVTVITPLGKRQDYQFSRPQ